MSDKTKKSREDVFKEIPFDANSGPLEIKFTFDVKMQLDYFYVLYDSDGRTKVKASPIINKDDSVLNEIVLPLPISVNKNRLFYLNSTFIGIDPDNFPKFEIKAEVFQNGVNIGKVEDPVKQDDSEKLDGKFQGSRIYILLK